MRENERMREFAGELGRSKMAVQGEKALPSPHARTRLARTPPLPCPCTRRGWRLTGDCAAPSQPQGHSGPVSGLAFACGGEGLCSSPLPAWNQKGHRRGGWGSWLSSPGWPLSQPNALQPLPEHLQAWGRCTSEREVGVRGAGGRTQAPSLPLLSSSLPSSFGSSGEQERLLGQGSALVPCP